MNAISSQITSLTIVYSTVYSDADQRKHQSSVSLAFVWGIHRGPVNSPHKWPVTRKMFPLDDVIMKPVWIFYGIYIYIYMYLLVRYLNKSPNDLSIRCFPRINFEPWKHLWIYAAYVYYPCVVHIDECDHNTGMCFPWIKHMVQGLLWVGRGQFTHIPHGYFTDTGAWRYV